MTAPAKNPTQCCAPPCSPCTCCDEVGGQTVAIDFADVTLPYLAVCGWDDDCGGHCSSNPGLERAFDAHFAGIPKRIGPVPNAPCDCSGTFGPFEYDAVEDSETCPGNTAGQFWVEIDTEYTSESETECVYQCVWGIYIGGPPGVGSLYIPTQGSHLTIPKPVNCNGSYTLDATVDINGFDSDVDITLHAIACHE